MEKKKDKEPILKKGSSSSSSKFRNRLHELSSFKNRSYSASLVKEFYSSIALKEKELEDSDDYVEDGLNVYLNGEEFVVTAEDLGSLLKIECEEGEYEFPEKYDSSSLWEIITRRKEKYSSKSNSGLIISPQIRILHYFIATNIQGRSGSLSYISLQDLWLMEHAFNGVALNMGRLIIEKMRGACKLDKVNLPYGNVITSLVQKKESGSRKDSHPGVKQPTKAPSSEQESKNKSDQGIEVTTSEDEHVLEKHQASHPNAEEISIMDIFHQMDILEKEKLKKTLLGQKLKWTVEI
ncbi:hypothetical protein QQP08_003852 [Theobroma cacao]|nr:hypothetical protein QQP08_003852 [Theobroma cacao]